MDLRVETPGHGERAARFPGLCRAGEEEPRGGDVAGHKQALALGEIGLGLVPRQGWRDRPAKRLGGGRWGRGDHRRYRDMRSGVGRSPVERSDLARPGRKP